MKLRRQQLLVSDSVCFIRVFYTHYCCCRMLGRQYREAGQISQQIKELTQQLEDEQQQMSVLQSQLSTHTTQLSSLNQQVSKTDEQLVNFKKENGMFEYVIAIC